MGEFKAKSVADTKAFEEVPINERMDVFNTYDLLKKGAAMDPDALALSFFLTADSYDQPMQITYRELMSQINRAANLFHDLGIGPKDVISYLLPNLPQTHYVLWGGEAAGIVNPINPLLEPATIAEICRSAGTSVLVSLGEFPGSDLWEKAQVVRKDLPDLKAVVRVAGPSDEKEGIYGFDDVLGNYNGDRLDSNRQIDRITLRIFCRSDFQLIDGDQPRMSVQRVKEPTDCDKRPFALKNDLELAKATRLGHLTSLVVDDVQFMLLG